MSRKKGKALALELVGDLFGDKSKPVKSKKANKNKLKVAKTQIDLPEETESISLPDDFPEHKDVTMRLTKEELNDLEVSAVDFPAEIKHTKKKMNTSQPKRKSKANDLSVVDSLHESMNIIKAQDKILELQQIIESMRSENGTVYASSETFKKQSDELELKLNDLTKKMNHQKIQFADEKELMDSVLVEKEKKLTEAKLENQQLQSRLSSNLKKIRVRERELENRLEIVRMENLSLQRTKDEHLLDLKRQIDDAQHQLESYKERGQVLDLQLESKKEMLRRTVKALRLALTMLESNEQELKMASGDDY